MQMHWRSVAAIVLAAFVVAAQPALALDMGALGGIDGDEFRLACEPGTVLVGVDAQEADGLITAIAAVCGDRTASPNDAATGPLAGADGGTHHAVICGPDSVITTLRVFVDMTRTVSRVGVTCLDMLTGQKRTRAPDFGGVDAGNLWLSCPDGLIGSGLYGRAGMAVGRLGLSCEEMVVAEGPVEPAIPGPEIEPPAAEPEPVPPAPASLAAVIISPVDVYDVPGGVGQVLGFVTPEDAIESDPAACVDNWCPISGPTVPGGGAGWVYADGFLEFRPQ